MKAFFDAVLPVLLPPLLTLLMAGSAWAFAQLAAWLKAKAKTSVVAREALVLEELVAAVVQDVEATEKQALTDRGSKPLSAGDAKQLKDVALSRVKALLQARGLDTLKAMLGALTEQPGLLDTYLSGKVEQAVAKLPASSSSSALTAAPALGAASVLNRQAQAAASPR